MLKRKINSNSENNKLKTAKRRIIAINRDTNRIKKPKILVHCLEIYLPKQITIEPAQNFIQTFKLKYQKTVTENQKLSFDFMNTSFNEAFTLKNDLMGILILIKTKDGKLSILFIVFHERLFINGQIKRFFFIPNWGNKNAMFKN